MDDRGSQTHQIKWGVEKLLGVKNHILSFPSYESHYTRKVNDKKYLPSHLTIHKVYDLYKEITVNLVSCKYYSAEFHKLKLTFKKPKIDTCHKCDIENRNGCGR